MVNVFPLRKKTAKTRHLKSEVVCRWLSSPATTCRTGVKWQWLIISTYSSNLVRLDLTPVAKHYNATLTTVNIFVFVCELKLTVK